MSDLRSTLGATRVFSSLDRRTVDRLAKTATRRSFAAGETIVREGDSGVAFYVIVSGRVRVERAGGGAALDLGELGSGDFFGELALIEEHARTATVTAVEETECVLLPVWEFKALLNEHPEMARVIMEALIRRLHRSEHT